MDSKQCKKCQQNFTIEGDDHAFYEKIGVLPPDLCPLCRAQLRLSFRNERVFYKRPCDKCKKDVVSMYSPNKPYTVWCYECWFADDWDGLDYTLEYDPSKTFFQQFAELWNAVPKVALIYVRSPGSEYTNISADNKNCYMIIESSNNEDSIHSYWIQECKEVVDTSFASKCELCYECDDCYTCYKLQHAKGCHDCTDGYFLLDCKGCINCVGCVNLRNMSNCIFNEQYSKEEYENKLKEFKLDTTEGVEAFRKQFAEFTQKQPRKYAEILNTTNSTGNYIKHAKNCRSCFHCYDAEDCAFAEHVWRNAKDCMDVSTAGRNANMIYNSINSGIDVANHICCVQGWSSTFLEYSFNCFNSNYLFGCAGLRKKDYCILNKQYSKEDFEALREQIVAELKESGEYGQFFPPEFSCFGYNESAAQEQFPLTKEQALAQGFKWEDTPRGTYGKEVTTGEVTKDIFACVNCKKNYRIIANEAIFYSKLNIPLPIFCPDCRHARRFAARGPNKLWHRKCMNGDCQNEFETPYSPDQPDVLYCESCYQREVV